MIVEVNRGVPSDLFTLIHNRGDDNNSIELSDETKMADINTQINCDATDESVTFELNIPPWWERFVHRCMQRDKRQILKRICIKMNQISSEDRAFVAAFIAAQKSDGQLFQTLSSGDVKVDVERTLQCSGRTLLHAAVAGGNFSCAAIIFMNGGWSLLSKADHQGVTPMDLAKNANQKELVELLNHYVELRSWEASEYESTVGKNSDADLKDVAEGEVRANGEDNRENDRENGEAESSQQDTISQKESKENSGISSIDETLNNVMDELNREQFDQQRENKEDLREGPPVPIRNVPQRMLKRGSSIEAKLHMPLRACKSVNIQDRPSSANSVFTRVEQIRPLSGKALSGTRKLEEKLPRVNTPTSSPMNSPRMGRKLVPSLLNTERPGSSVLRPRSPTCPRPRSPMVPRSRSPTAPNMRNNVVRTCSSPEPRRRALTFHGGDNGRERKMSREMQDFLMSHYEARETKPWNVWKTVRKSQLDQSDWFDDDEDSSSEDENEKLSRFLQTSRSNRRKTFEMWLTDKEAAQARQQTALAGIAKQQAMTRRKEANWRLLTGKTHQQWLEEQKSDDFKSRKPTDGEQSEERKAEAVRKYQEWLQAKDEEALKREDQLRKEAAAKFTESQQKRDDKLQRTWFKKKLLNTS